MLLGKLPMHEFAWGASESSTGGSSSGSGAALAARLCVGALGSDTGGSIRSPANVCGITGLETTYGLVRRYGVAPLSWSLDTCGPMRVGGSLRGVRVGVPRSWLDATDALDPEVRAAFELAVTSCVVQDRW